MESPLKEDHLRGLDDHHVCSQVRGKRGLLLAYQVKPVKMFLQEQIKGIIIILLVRRTYHERVLDDHDVFSVLVLRTGVQVSFVDCVRDEYKKEAWFSCAFVVFSLALSRSLTLSLALSRSLSLSLALSRSLSLIPYSDREVVTGMCCGYGGVCRVTGVC